MTNNKQMFAIFVVLGILTHSVPAWFIINKSVKGMFSQIPLLALTPILGMLLFIFTSAITVKLASLLGYQLTGGSGTNDK